MPTEYAISLFLFAHQDDEFAAQKLIEDDVAEGLCVKCAFFTQGHYPSLNSRRNQESINVLTRLGVQLENVYFVGMSLQIEDGELQEHIDVFAHWLQNQLTNHLLKHIWIPAWEGGHPDHDVLHAVVVEIAQRAGILERVRQFPLYNAWQCHGSWFRVLFPLPHNGQVECRPINWKSRWRYLRHCLGYPSQAISWIGLFPFVMLNMLTKGVQHSQNVTIARISKRPHEGRLYYETRGFSTWEVLNKKLSNWIKSI